MIERGTLPDQRVVTGTLETIARRRARPASGPRRSPCSARCAALREQLDWFERAPAGRRRRSRSRARGRRPAGWRRGCARSAPQVVEAPAIRIVPLDGPAPELERYDLVCLTSPNGVRLLFERLAARRPRRPGAGRRAGRGDRARARRAALREHGVIADVVPERFVAEGLVEALADVPVAARADRARGRGARRAPRRAARARRRGRRGGAVRDGRRAARPTAQLEAVERADYVTFTSSSTVRSSSTSSATRLRPTDAAGRASARSPARRCASAGSSPHVEAERHDIDGLVAGAVADAHGDGPRPMSARRSSRSCRTTVPGRLRRRLPRRDRRRSAPQARVIDLTHGVARHDVRAGALVLRAALPLHAGRRPSRRRRSRRRRAAPRGRAAARPTGGCSSGPTTACCRSPPRPAAGVVEAVDIARSRCRLEPLSATFHGRDIFAPVAAHLAGGGAPRRRSGEPLDPAELVGARAAARPASRAGALVAHVVYVDVFGNVQLDAGHEDLAGSGCGSGAPVELRARRSGAAAGASFARTFADVARRRAAPLRGRAAAARARGQPRRRGAARSALGDRRRAADQAAVSVRLGHAAAAPAPHRLDQRARPRAGGRRRAARDARHRRASRPPAAGRQGRTWTRARRAARCSARW